VPDSSILTLICKSAVFSSVLLPAFTSSSLLFAVNRNSCQDPQAHSNIPRFSLGNSSFFLGVLRVAFLRAPSHPFQPRNNDDPDHLPFKDPLSVSYLLTFPGSEGAPRQMLHLEQPPRHFHVFFFSLAGFNHAHAASPPAPSGRHGSPVGGLAAFVSAAVRSPVFSAGALAYLAPPPRHDIPVVQHESPSQEVFCPGSLAVFPLNELLFACAKGPPPRTPSFF